MLYWFALIMMLCIYGFLSIGMLCVVIIMYFNAQRSVLIVVCPLYVSHSSSSRCGYDAVGHWRPMKTQSNRSGSEPAPDRTCLWPLRFQKTGHVHGADWWSCHCSLSPGRQLKSPDGPSDAPSLAHSTPQRCVSSCEQKERG